MGMDPVRDRTLDVAGGAIPGMEKIVFVQARGFGRPVPGGCEPLTDISPSLTQVNFSFH